MFDRNYSLFIDHSKTCEHTGYVSKILPTQTNHWLIRTVQGLASFSRPPACLLLPQTCNAPASTCRTTQALGATALRGTPGTSTTRVPRATCHAPSATCYGHGHITTSPQCQTFHPLTRHFAKTSIPPSPSSGVREHMIRFFISC